MTMSLDYRTEVAEILDGLAGALPYTPGPLFTGDDEFERLARGAQTLRWARDHEYGASTPDDLRERIDELEGQLENAPDESDVEHAATEGAAEANAQLARAEKVLTALRAYAKPIRDLSEADLLAALTAYDAGK